MRSGASKIFVPKRELGNEDGQDNVDIASAPISGRKEKNNPHTEV